MGFHQESEVWNTRIKMKTTRHNLIGLYVWDGYAGINMAPFHHRHPTTIAHRPPIPVDHLEWVLKVPWTHSTIWVNTRPVLACICPDLCRVHPNCSPIILRAHLPLLHRQCRCALPACKMRCYESPYRGRSALLMGGSVYVSLGRHIYHLQSDDTFSEARCNL